MAGRGSRIFTLVVAAVYESVNELDYLSNGRWLLSNCPMRLSRIWPLSGLRRSRVVELGYFAGLSVEETAEALGISLITIMRDWTTAKAWLSRTLGTATGSRQED